MDPYYGDLEVQTEIGIAVKIFKDPEIVDYLKIWFRIVQECHSLNIHD